MLLRSLGEKPADIEENSVANVLKRRLRVLVRMMTDNPVKRMLDYTLL